MMGVCGDKTKKKKGCETLVGIMKLSSTLYSVFHKILKIMQTKFGFRASGAPKPTCRMALPY